jgi:hypothetical protein
MIEAQCSDSVAIPESGEAAKVRFLLQYHCNILINRLIYGSFLSCPLLDLAAKVRILLPQRKPPLETIPLQMFGFCFNSCLKAS